MGCCQSKEESNPCLQNNVKDIEKSPGKKRPRKTDDSSSHEQDLKAKPHTESLKPARISAAHDEKKMRTNNLVKEAVKEEMRRKQPLYLEGDPSKKYEIIKELAGTIHGSINLGKDKKTGDFVAIKISKAAEQCLENPGEEVRLMQILQDAYFKSQTEGNKEYSPFHLAHPGFVKLKGSYIKDFSLWTVLEFCGGGDCFDYVLEAAPLSEKEAKGRFREIVEAIKFMHKSGVCHLDLSLENVLLSTDRQHVKICDFGMAREIAYNEEGSVVKYLPKDGLPGKPKYKAPEIFAAKPFDGTKADIFSLGVCLFILLVGKPPFSQANKSCQYFKFLVVHGIKKMLPHYKVQVGDQAVDLMEKMLARIPSRRIDIKGILNHPWLTSGAVSIEEEKLD
mmetsp:Transcript_24382/g.36580  ORF Transcript_24382/g.36580 Transcript_24382/m.36580 type:complete len:393 (+) Transcript_24382:52-1230(+)